MDFEEKQIAQYIKGLLPPQDMAAADARYQSDPGFKATVDEERMLMDLAGLSHAMHVAEQVSAARARHAAAKAPQKRRPWYLWGIAASIVLLVGFGLYALRPSIYDDHYEKLDLGGNYAGPGPVQGLADRLYQKKEYKSALIEYQKITGETIAADSALYLAGLCQMELRDFEAAIKTLESVLPRIQQRPDDSFLCDVRWYLALALIHEDLNDEAKSLLQLVKTDCPNQNTQNGAAEVLQEIEQRQQFWFPQWW